MHNAIACYYVIYIVILYMYAWSAVVRIIASPTHYFFSKRSHCCLFCPSRAGQEVKKAVVVSKCRQNFEQSKIHTISYSGKLSREKTFTNFEVLEPPASFLLKIWVCQYLCQVFAFHESFRPRKFPAIRYIRWNQHRKPNDTWLTSYNRGTCTCMYSS